MLNINNGIKDPMVLSLLLELKACSRCRRLGGGGGDWDNGKENGNYYSILGIYGDNGKENGNYYLGFRVWGLGLGVYYSRV